MQRSASSSFSCCDGLRASWSVKEPSSSLPARLPGPALGAGKIGSCLEKQAGGGSEIAAGKRTSRAPGCSSSCCSPTGFPGPPAPLRHSPFPSFSPVTGALASCPQPCPCSALPGAASRSGLALPLGPPISHSPLEPWQEQQGPSVAHGHPSSVSGFLFMKKRVLPPKKHSQTCATNPGDTGLCCIRCKA